MDVEKSDLLMLKRRKQRKHTMQAIGRSRCQDSVSASSGRDENIPVDEAPPLGLGRLGLMKVTILHFPFMARSSKVNRPTATRTKVAVPTYA